MKVELVIQGGIAALNLPRGGLRSPPVVIDTADLSEAEARELKRLVEAAEAMPTPKERPRPDAASHRITVTEQGQSRSIIGREGMIPPEIARLISWIRQHAPRAGSRSAK